MRQELLTRLREAMMSIRNPYLATGKRHPAFDAGVGAAWDAVRKAIEAMPEPPEPADPEDVRVVTGYIARGYAPAEVQAACRRLRRFVEGRAG